VVWAFAGRFVNYEQNHDYYETLRCNSGMTPSIITLDAAWGFQTAFSFDLVRDVPKVQEGTGFYYIIRPRVLRETMVNNPSDADGGTPSISSDVTFRAEYVCNCPAGYELRSTRFNDITSCTKCIPGTVRRTHELECTPCPLGTYETDGNTQCTPCPAGTYGIEAGKNTSALACQPCPPLSASLQPGATSCVMCNTIKDNTYALPSGAVSGKVGVHWVPRVLVNHQRRAVNL
jgi:hypothetical protein